MEYQKVINLLDNTPNQLSKFKTENWVEIYDDESRRTFGPNVDIKFRNSMLKSNLCDYRDAYVHVKETITIPNTGTTAAPINTNKKLIFENCTPFVQCISEINNTEIDNVQDIDVVMPMYNL